MRLVAEMHDFSLEPDENFFKFIVWHFNGPLGSAALVLPLIWIIQAMVRYDTGHAGYNTWDAGWCGNVVVINFPANPLDTAQTGV